MRNVPVTPESPMAKAMAAAQAAAESRLVVAADALEVAMQGRVVLFDRKLQRRGCAAVRVLFSWPGYLLVLDPVGDEIVRESPASDMSNDAPVEAAFLARKTSNRPLVAAPYQPPGGVRLRATFAADGVVRVHAVKGGALLAESEPGEPRRLRAGFHPLSAQDLAPRID